ncbi:DUF3024 domain-containing protein [Arsenicicoccus sp. oral taxon 190]|uniref:DUF3024 domain-containing protein n=1 Tax=Arsenicicoccus sp. oral taxon 190 TaxID=1658671 RepID=UPI00067A2548|nr:hypothetical protein [Arsenicicoccus sp. oral taxon 190]AKT51215.1 hypothetical protein ADJ73_07645 [Arsenicicoccus sp. oral taxon 190]
MVYRKGTKKPIPVERAISERDRMAVERACRDAVPPRLRSTRRVDFTVRHLTVRVYVHAPVDPTNLDGEWRSRHLARLTYQPDQAAWTLTYPAGNRWRDTPELMGSLRLVLQRTVADQAQRIVEG